jgi:class 3 adenylate cyclase/tetratricopeptide (TPR) repeat protein
VPLARTCPSCGSRAAATAKFCPECGRSLIPRAGDPRFASPQSYTPHHLAQKILTSREALEGERKLITVLFADVKGSTELLAERNPDDPEEARRLLDPVIEHMIEAVHRYEGTVNRVVGDGIMALFGAPLAHEDHAVRASYAALRMQEAIRHYSEKVRRSRGIEVLIRVGLNSGDVLVRTIGSDLRMDYTADGLTTHLAARMEQLATPGTVLMTADTLRLAEGHVTVKTLGPVPVKGLEAPIEVYELRGAGPRRSRLHAAAARGLSRFVGRDGEVGGLHQALVRAAGGHGQVVALVGEPGVGKSRLVWEVTHSHRVHGWLVLQAASVSYGKATSYLPVVELLKSYLAIEDRDEPQTVREKLTGKLVTLDWAQESSLPALLSLLDVPTDDSQWSTLDPAQRRRRTLDALKILLLRESQVQPLLVVFEDLHWIDTETQALLDGLVESLPAARLLLLVNYRSEYQHPWGNKTYYTQLRLDPLPPETAEELLVALLGADASLDALKRVLIARTEGNPFFLEESVRALVEIESLLGERGSYRLARPLPAIQVPATVQAVLATRIDRLQSGDKALLQTASVIGKDIPLVLLQAIAEDAEEELHAAIGRLQAAELVYETQLFPELEYTFKHALTHEVTYGSIVQERRRALHAAIVDAIERLHAGRLNEHVERLAHHALCGELREKAVHYLRQAGLKATARSALLDARVWFEQALGALKALPDDLSTLEQAFETRLELRPVLQQLGEVRPALECLREAENLAERLNDDRRRGRVCALMTNIHSQLGELDEARASGTRARAIAQALGDLELRILSTTYLENARYLRGEYEQVVELATDNLAALPAEWVHEYVGLPVPASVYDRCWLVLSLAQLGRFAEAAEFEAEAIQLAEPTQRAFAVSMAHYASGTLHLLKGDWTKARSLIEQWIGVVRAGNVVLHLPWAVASSAWVLAQLGETSEALCRLQEGEQLLDHHAARGIVGYRGWAYHALGRASLLVGRLDEAQRLGDRALESSPSHPGFAAHALYLRGDIVTHPDRCNAESGEAQYRKALALAEPRGMRPLVAHCHLGLGKLLQFTGKRDQAGEHLTTATTMYREMDMQFWLKQVDAAMGQLG